MTAHPLGLKARRNEAFRLFKRGYSNVAVAEEMRISESTACRYRQVWLKNLESEAAEQPDLLRNVLGNTVRTLEELDDLRERAARDYDSASNAQTKAALLNIQLRALDQRAKLLGLMGVKQDVLLHIGQVRELQTKILTFLERELCARDRAKLEAYLTAEFASQLEGMDTVDDLLNAAAPGSA